MVVCTLLVVLDCCILVVNSLKINSTGTPTFALLVSALVYNVELVGFLVSRFEARPPLKGKLDSLEMRNAVTGAEIARSAFGPILEVTCRKENFVGHCLDESLVTEDTQKALFDNFPLRMHAYLLSRPH